MRKCKTTIKEISVATNDIQYSKIQKNSAKFREHSIFESHWEKHLGGSKWINQVSVIKKTSNGNVLIYEKWKNVSDKKSFFK